MDNDIRFLFVGIGGWEWVFISLCWWYGLMMSLCEHCNEAVT